MPAFGENESGQHDRTRVETFGPDRVEIRGDRVVIHSPVDMDRWQVVEYRKPRIRFDGRTWTLASKSLDRDGLIQYELEPWEPAEFELHGHELQYGSEIVESRERELQHSRRLALETSVLRLLSPLAGFLFARTKGRLEDRLGMTAVTMTWRSLILQYLVMISAFTYTTIGVQSGISHGFLAGEFSETLGGVQPVAILAVVLLPDAIVRWGRLLGDERLPPGFYEWLWRSAP